MRHRLHTPVLALAILAAMVLPTLATTVAEAPPPEPVLSPLVAIQMARGDAQIPVIIVLADTVTQTDLARLASMGFAAPSAVLRIVPAVATAGDAAAIDQALAWPRVTAVDADSLITPLDARPNTVSRAEGTWNASYRLSGNLHTTGFTGRGVRVAIFDTGIDATHPDLIHHSLAAHEQVPAKTIANLDSTTLREQDLVMNDNHGHGTRTAGAAVGTGRASDGRHAGAAPGAELVGVKIRAEVGNAGFAFTVSSLGNAIDLLFIAVADLDVRVVVIPWEARLESAMYQALDSLVHDLGAIVVIPAGNDGGDGSVGTTNPLSTHPSVISVGAYDEGTGEAAQFSSRGSREDPTTWPIVLASGVNVMTTARVAEDDLQHVFTEGPRTPSTTPYVSAPGTRSTVAAGPVTVGPYHAVSGTSIAAAHVGGIVALLLEANPALTWAEVKAILEGTANMPGAYVGEDARYVIGSGVVDAAGAVAAALRMRDGHNPIDALAFGHVEDNAGDFTLNDAVPEHLAFPDLETATTLPLGPLAIHGRLVDGPRDLRIVPGDPAMVTAPNGAAADSTDDGHAVDALRPVPQGIAAVSGQHPPAEGTIRYRQADPGRAPATDAARLHGTGGAGILFADDFDAVTHEWTAEQNGNLEPGRLTTWSRIWRNDPAAPAGLAAYHGNGAYRVGVDDPAGLTPGVVTTSPDVSLVSPPIAITGPAELTFFMSGSGMTSTSLEVFAEIVGTGERIAIHAVRPPGWPPDVQGLQDGEWHAADLTKVQGSSIRLHFRLNEDNAGWIAQTGYILDDVTVRSTGGILPAAATLTAGRTMGIGSLAATFTASGTGGEHPLRFDPGDRSPVQELATGDHIIHHTYGPGVHVATLTSRVGATTITDSVVIEVAPIHVVEVRIGDGPWVAATTDPDDPHRFRVDVDTSDRPPGTTWMEARMYTADGTRLQRAIQVTLAEA